MNNNNMNNQTNESSPSFGKGPQDKWSFLTHLFGAILGTVGTVYLVISNWPESTDQVGRFVTMTLFGASMIALYSCSAIYHFCPGPPEKAKSLRKLDHSMIYVLIAGTYTPILFNGLEHPVSTVFLCIIWGLAAAGIIVKVCWLDAPRWLYTSLYLIMGWAIVFVPKTFTVLPFDFVMMLLLGGVSYTVGAIFYIVKKPNFSKEFGFHELFHCFILLGTLSHYLGVVLFL